MDDIWRKAAKKIREHRGTATQTLVIAKPTAATPSAVPTCANTPASLNTVAQCDARLLRMEFEWKLTRSGPFPDGIRNTIVNLRAALAIREAETSPKSGEDPTTPPTARTTFDRATEVDIRKLGRPWYGQTAVTRPYLVDTV